MRYDDMAYVAAYNERGEYPKIHDDIFSLDEGLPRGVVADIGACHGLLAARLVNAGHTKCLAFEMNPRYLAEAIRDKRIEYHGYPVSYTTLGFFAGELKDAGVSIVFARRVIPEIWDRGGEKLVRGFAGAMFAAGVKYLVVEGRLPTARAVNGMNTIEREIAALNGFKEIKRFKNCALLERN